MRHCMLMAMLNCPPRSPFNFSSLLPEGIRSELSLTCRTQNTRHSQPLSLCCIQRREIARGKKLFRLFAFEAHNHLKRPLMNAPVSYQSTFCGILCANTLNVFAKHKCAHFGLLSILARRGKTVFTPSSRFPGAAPYTPVADSKPQRVIPFLGELRPRSRSAGLVLT